MADSDIARASEVSIHAPAWGATPTSRDRASGPTFQSTRPRGARPFPLFDPAELPSFNPRARVGRDLAICRRLRLSGALFQSTRPRGARRLYGGLSVVWPAEFQSTRPRGARLFGPLACDDQGEFQSTRPRGARLQPLSDVERTGRSFNPRARVGRDCLTHNGRARNSRRFNPRARVGRDRLSAVSGGFRIAFQSTRPRGARPPLDHRP